MGLIAPVAVKLAPVMEVVAPATATNGFLTPAEVAIEGQYLTVAMIRKAVAMLRDRNELLPREGTFVVWAHPSWLDDDGQLSIPT